ncbi:MAG: CDP-alcohol phosphatidyltransferase family protein [Nitrospinaceae bacterium]
MDEKIAGLDYSERLRRTAEQAGYDHTLFLPPASPEESWTPPWRALQPLQGSCFVLFKRGYLPDTRYLESVKEWGAARGQFTVGDHSPVLVYCAEDPHEWLEKVAQNHGRPGLFDLLQKDFPTKIQPGPAGKVYELQSAEQIPRIESLLFQSLIKDTEGFMSRNVERKISLAISRRLVNTSISPNQMTLFSIGVGLAGACLLGIQQGILQITGACLFLAHSILDGCDGELARIKFLQSRWGGLMDFWGDNIVHSAVFLALALEWSRRTHSLFPIVLGGLALLGTVASASWVYWHTMRPKGDKEPLYTSVSVNQEKSKVTEIADFLSRRDFIYLVVLLSFFHKLDWFLVLSAVGAPLFFLVLVWIHFQERRVLEKKRSACTGIGPEAELMESEKNMPADHL